VVNVTLERIIQKETAASRSANLSTFVFRLRDRSKTLRAEGAHAPSLKTLHESLNQFRFLCSYFCSQSALHLTLERDFLGAHHHARRIIEGLAEIMYFAQITE
jgi:hypothetical protein